MRLTYAFAIQWLLPGFLAAASGCGSNPAQPTPAPTVSSVTLTGGTDVVRVRETVTFGVTARMSDGSSPVVQPQWSSDNVAVATVDPTGRVTGVSNGTVTISATHQGSTASRGLRVVPDYQGLWEGLVQVKVCDQTPSFQPSTWCAGRRTKWFEASLTAEQTRDVVTGGLWLGHDPFPVCNPGPGEQCAQFPIRPGKAASFGLQLTIDAAGRLTGGGTVLMVTPTGTFLGMVGGWVGDLPRSFLEGRSAISWSGAGPGNAYEEVEFSLSRTSPR
jgi:hypothetical protein